MQDVNYLTTEEAAAYLRLKERKLYELVARAAVPCTKVSGKWLFPRAALDRWLESGLVQPEALRRRDGPPIIGGSQDPLLEIAVRDSGCGYALLAEGSRAGLERLLRDEVALVAIHLHANSEDDDANLTAVRMHAALHDAVVIAFARREQGLLVAPGNPLKVAGLAGAVARRARFAQRQEGAGAQLLLARLLQREAIPTAHLILAESVSMTGQDLALAIRTGRADCGIASRAVATAFGLEFQPLLWEYVDLVMRRRSYFEPGPQKLMAWMRGPAMAQRASELGGYDLRGCGKVRLNR